MDQLAAKLDQPSGHVLGMGTTYLGFCLFFIVLFLATVWIGNIRRKHKGPPPPPIYPILRDKPQRRERQKHEKK